MTQIPEQVTLTPEQAYEQLQKWFQQQQQLTVLKTAEVLERKRMAGFYFPQPREGSNRLDLGGGYDLKLDFAYSRNVDEAALDAAKAADFRKLHIDKEDLFPLKPTLNLKAYRKLSDAQRAFVDELLDTKEATPQLHIVPQAEKDAPAEEAAAAPAPRKRAAAKKAPAVKKAAAKKAPAAPKRGKK